ncbi:MAG: transcriptional repressor [Anaerolineae bacterium]|nr:transcriptional repressor [Anaerolineae bacterium]
MPGGIQLTRQREAVLMVLKEAEKHLTAQEVYDRVRQRLPGTAYGTVYNALAYLQSVGLVQAFNIGNGPALYDRRIDRHDHLRCLQCGEVIDYSLSGLDQVVERVARETGYQINRARLLFEGLCPKCQKSKEVRP